MIKKNSTQINKQKARLTNNIKKSLHKCKKKKLKI
jgi:hypothetical protein